VPLQGPNFSPFPFDRLPRRSRRDAAIESALARWIAPGRLGAKIASLAGGEVRARLIGVVSHVPDPHVAVAELRYGGASIMLAASSQPVRALAQRLLGGPPELAAPRPLTVAEHAIWALAVATALADLGVAAEVWPLAEAGRAGAGADPPSYLPSDLPSIVAFEVALPAALGGSMTVTATLPPDLLLRAPPPRPLHAWDLDLPIVVGRCALPRASVTRLAVRDIITIDPRLELLIGAGGIGLSAASGAVEARVATEYVPRDMALPDDAHLEVTVQLGTTRLSLRQLGELAIGQIVALGRPLAGPYEVRAAGRLVGQGELVDIDGELGVRIVSIAQTPDQE
jgi:Type III flagellar switch regulator (C-ring) FliN C-term